MLAKLSTSALSAEQGKKLGMEPYTAAECKELKLPATKAGFLIPYFTLDGKVDKFFRFRYLEDTRTGFDKLTKKLNRFWSVIFEVFAIFMALL